MQHPLAIIPLDRPVLNDRQIQHVMTYLQALLLGQRVPLDVEGENGEPERVWAKLAWAGHVTYLIEVEDRRGKQVYRDVNLSEIIKMGCSLPVGVIYALSEGTDAGMVVASQAPLYDVSRWDGIPIDLNEDEKEYDDDWLESSEADARWNEDNSPGEMTDE